MSNHYVFISASSTCDRAGQVRTFSSTSTSTSTGRAIKDLVNWRYDFFCLVDDIYRTGAKSRSVQFGIGLFYTNRNIILTTDVTKIGVSA